MHEHRPFTVQRFRKAFLLLQCVEGSSGVAQMPPWRGFGSGGRSACVFAGSGFRVSRLGCFSRQSLLCGGKLRWQGNRAHKLEMPEEPPRLLEADPYGRTNCLSDLQRRRLLAALNGGRLYRRNFGPNYRCAVARMPRETPRLLEADPLGRTKNFITRKAMAGQGKFGRSGKGRLMFGVNSVAESRVRDGR